MTMYDPIILETEASGAVGAYVPGRPVYAAAATYRKAEQAMCRVLIAYLEAHPRAEHGTQIRLARVPLTAKAHQARPKVRIVSVGALLGSRRSRFKTRAARAGRRGEHRRKAQPGRSRLRGAFDGPAQARRESCDPNQHHDLAVRCGPEGRIWS